MFTKNENGGEINKDETIIGKSVKIEGDFFADENILIEGEIIGSLKTNKALIIAPTAKIKADIEAKNISIAGTVEGNIKCSEKIEIKTSGKIFGDIQTNIIAVETGAMIKGHCLSGSNVNTIPNKDKKESK